MEILHPETQDDDLSLVWSALSRNLATMLEKETPDPVYVQELEWTGCNTQ